MSIHRVTDAVRQGSISENDLVWSKGWSEWVKIKDSELFGYLFQAPPTPELFDAQEQVIKDTPIAPSALEHEAPPAVIRFWARMLDLAWYIIVLAFAAAQFYNGDQLLKVMQESAAWQILLNATMFLLFVPLEAWMLAKFGTTPGKALLGLRVKNLDGGLPSFKQALYRSLSVAIRGVGLGIPIYGWFTMLFARIRLLRFGISVWDEQAQTEIISVGVPKNRLRTIAVFTILALLFLLYTTSRMQHSLEP